MPDAAAPGPAEPAQLAAVTPTLPQPPRSKPPQPQLSEQDAAALAAASAGLTVHARGQLRLATERFLHHKPALAGLAVFVVMLLASTVGIHFWKYNYTQITKSFGTGPSLAHPFGTDTIGHDLLAQVLRGTATSLETALIVAVLSTVVGTLIGALAGYYGKWADSLLMRFTDLVLVVPVLAIMLVLAAGVSNLADNPFIIALVLAGLFWTYLARLVRGTFMSLREREYIEAERAIGATDWRIILRHLVPNAIGPIVVNATLTVANALLIESTLSFLGLGVQPPSVSLGVLVDLGQGDATVQPWLFYFPAGFLVLAILAVNFIGDGLQDALDPTQRGR